MPCSTLWGYGPAVAGGIGAIMAVAWSTGAVTVANFDGMGRRLTFISIGAAVVVVGLLVSLASMAEHLLSLVMLGQLVIGLGMGIAWGSLCQVVMETYPEGERDKASALLPTLQSAGYAGRFGGVPVSSAISRALQPILRRKDSGSRWSPPSSRRFCWRFPRLP